MLNQLETSGFEYHVVKDSLHIDGTEMMVYAKRADREI
jgi:hypothetical protein